MNAPVSDPLLLLSTDGLDPRERYDYWRDSVFCYFDAAPMQTQDAQHFEGHVVSLANDWGDVHSYRTSPVSGRRTRRQYRSDGGDDIVVIYMRAGRAIYQPEGDVPTEAGPGMLFCYLAPPQCGARRDDRWSYANLTADYDAYTTQFFGEVGYALPVTAKTTLEAFAGLAWRELRSESFREKGGSAALHASTNNNDVTTTTLGLRTKTDIKLNGRDASLNAMLGWRHAEADVTPTSRFAFQGGQSFTVTGAPIARDAALIEVGASMMLSRNASLGISYTGEYGEGNRDHTGRINLRWKF